MKRLLLFAPFLLAAHAADSDHLAEGQWESLFQIESSSTDGKKQHQQTAPIYPPSRCVKGARPHLWPFSPIQKTQTVRPFH